MSSPQISIIVPAYNSSDTIERCIRSIVNQTFKDWELIIVDNGSSDCNVDVVNSLANEEQRIVLLEEPEKGVSNARNKGLDFARGNFICFVDSDDTAEPDYLEQMVRHSTSDLVVCGYYVDTIDQLGNNLKSGKFIPTPIEWDSKVSKKCLYSTFANGFIHICCNKLFRRSIIDEFKLRFEQYPVNEDYIFIMNYLLHSQKICVTNLPLYHWIRIVNTTTGVNSIPPNLLSIYNKSHELTREFFEDNAIADKIAFYSYELILLTKLSGNNNLDSLCKNTLVKTRKDFINNGLVKDAFNAYKPDSLASYLSKFLLIHGCFKIHSCIFNNILSKLRNE